MENHSSMRTIGIVVWSVFLLVFATTLFLYPVLHELGHALAAILCGGRVHQIVLYPEAYALCEIPDANVYASAVVAVSGILFPLLCSLLPQDDGTTFIVALSLRAMSIIYSIQEVVSVAVYATNGTAPHTDLCSWVEAGGTTTAAVIISIILLCASLSAVANRRMLRRAAERLSALESRV